MNELADKIALVVGAGCIGDEIGIGRATAISFAREGAVVVCADLDETSAARTAAMIREEGGRATSTHVDVTDEQSVRSCISATLTAHGRIDVLDNNVGIAPFGGATDVDLEVWQRALSVNLTGPLLTMRFAIPHMIEQGRGSIVNISSIASLRWTGLPYAGYYSSKAGLNHLTRTTAAEFADRGVRVNAVLPGLIRTPMVANAAVQAGADLDKVWQKRDKQVPMGHMGTAWHVADAALFLASDRSSYVTGTELVVDGGISLGFAR